MLQIMKGDPKRKFEDIHWLFTEKELTHFSFKAKMNTNKTIICHLLETGITTKVLLEKGLLAPLVNKIAVYMKEDDETVIQFISFLSALHDIGKIHPHFQSKIGNTLTGMEVHESLPFRHEQYGAEVILDNLSFISAQIRENMSKIIALHHQGHKKNSFYIPKDSEICNQIQKEVIDILFRTFPFQLSSSRWRYTNGVASIISAIVNLSDWIASTKNTFSEEGYQDTEDYILSLEKQAYQFLKNNYILYEPERFEKVQCVHDFFSTMHIQYPRPMQETIIKLCEKYPTGGLMIVEAPCGEGKTAASLYGASHFKGTNGFYMALPTSATSESIHDEVDLICQQAKPEIKLPVFNGRAWMSEKDISIDSDLWVSPSRQKMFYPVAVGTVDQIIKSSLMEKYGLLRMLALLGKTVIIDEMHAYDIYMQDMIEQFLAYCGMFQVPVIILSATLPSSIKGKLLSAYSGFGEKNRSYILNGVEQVYDGKWKMSTAYPLITMASNTDYGKTIEITENSFQASKQQTYEYEMVSISKEYIREISDLCLDKIKDGGCLAVIVNLVDDAKELYRYLKKHTDAELYLLHGRNTENNKELLSNQIKKLFGKDRSFRPKKSIVISTQILEQSMDIDFDFMFSMLAPIDLLLQRFGRYRRHGDYGTIREHMMLDDKISIFVPDTEKKHTIIYEDEIIEKTKKLLQKDQEKILKLPKETRMLIEEVYHNHKVSAKETKKDMKAQERIISAPQNRDFSYFEESFDLKSRVETRYTDTKTYDVAVLSQEMIGKLKDDSSLELIKTIRKKYTVSGISEQKLKKNGILMFEDVKFSKPKLLKDTLIFQEDRSQIWIDEIYGLEILK